MVGSDAVTECLSRAAESRVKGNSCSNSVSIAQDRGSVKLPPYILYFALRQTGVSWMSFDDLPRHTGFSA